MNMTPDMLTPPSTTFIQRLGLAFKSLGSPRWLPIVYTEVAAVILLAIAVLPGGFDYLHYFYRLARGCVACTYNPYFTEWFMRPFGVVEAWRVSYILFCAFSMFALYRSARAFGGNPLIALASPTFMWILWLGQIDLLPVLGLALAWWALQQDRHVLMGVGLLLMATKPQMMGFALLLMLWWGGWKAWLIPIAAAVASFAIYGLDWVSRWLSYTPQTMFGGDAWFYISSIWLLIGVVGVFALKREKEHRLVRVQYLVTATLIGVPYIGAYSFFVLTVFRLRWWEVVAGYIAFALMGVTGNQWWLGVLLLQPLLIMGRLLWQSRAPTTTGY